MPINQDVKDFIQSTLELKAEYENDEVPEDDDLSTTEELLIEDWDDLQNSGYLTGDDGYVLRFTNGRKVIIRLEEV